MPDGGFYDTNQYIDYPFVHGDFFGAQESSSASLSCTPVLTLPVKCIVDAGFILGLDSQFVDGQDSVFLYEAKVAGGTVTLDFRSDASGLTAYRWLFSFDAACLFGTTLYADAETVSGGVPAPDRGTGFIVLGNTEELLALPDETYALCDTPTIEPALLHNLGKAYLRSVNLANTSRECGVACCESSSSSSAQPADAYVYVEGLQGDIRIKEGYNIRTEINPLRNQIEIRAQIGAGDGPACADILILGDGPENFFSEESSSLCANCDNYVRSINGLVVPNGHLKLVGSSGITIVSDPANNKIVADLSQIRACQN